MHPENRALREAMHRSLPLIWFTGFAPGQYAAFYPVYLVAEEQWAQQFVVAMGQDQRAAVIGGGAIDKVYTAQLTRQRLHQPAFRAGVMRAYETRCAICSFRHSNLLDAAHIIPDSSPDGSPATSNGLALCKIHHGAYDANILGIRPDLTIEVRSDVLAEVDGPMLKHGIQDHHNKSLMVVPAVKADRPDPQRLAVRYEEFRLGQSTSRETRTP